MTVEFPGEKYHENWSYRFLNPGHKFFFLSEKEEIQWFLLFFFSPVLLLEFLILGCAPRTLGMWQQHDCKIFSSTKGRIRVQRSCHLGVCLPSPSLIHSRTDSKVMGPVVTNSCESQPHYFGTGLECFQGSWVWA